MRPIKRLIIHCSATRPAWMVNNDFADQVAEIRRWHVEERGWSDIGYHWLIGRKGETAPGRPEERIGAHARGFNRESIGICLLGGHGSAATDEFSDHFTKQQDAALYDLVTRLRSQYGNLAVTGHNQHAAKACPGFQVSRWVMRNLQAGMCQ